jgi:spermidine synthase
MKGYFHSLRTGVCLCARTVQVFSGGSVSYAYTTIPTYPSGQIGMMVCCKGEALDARTPRQPPPGHHEGLGIPPLRCGTR